MKIGIIGGRGRLGQTFKRFFEQQGFEVVVSGRSTELSHEELAKTSDVVIVSVPIKATEEIIKQVAPLVREDALLMDFTSVKEMPYKTMMKYASSSVLACHPMFGPSNLQAGQTVVFCGGRGKAWQKKMEEIFSDFRLVKMSAEEHDMAMALVQSVEHFMKVCFAKTIAENGQLTLQDLQKVESPIYKIQMLLVGRILAQDEKLYSQITYATNKSKKMIEAFIKNAEEILRGGEEKFQRAFLQAHEFFGDFCTEAHKKSDELISTLIQKDEKKERLSKNKKAEIATLGPKLTWSDIALQKFFPDKKKVLFGNFSAVFDALESGQIKEAFLPIENSVSGSVRAVLKNIWRQKLWISEVYDLSIAHVLASPRQEEITKIFGHEAAIAQCSQFLRKYQNAEILSVESSTAAIQRARNERNSAAICSGEAAMDNGLFLIEKNIQEAEKNTTRFALISKNPPQTFTGQISSVIFELKNEPGSLLGALEIFKQHNINLSKFESMPTGKTMSEYAFLLDFDGKPDQSLLADLEKYSSKLQVIGNFSIHQ